MNKFLNIGFIVLVAAACVGHRPKTAEPSDLVDSLKTKYDGWLKELAALQDKNTGWAALSDCDGTLWTGEAVAAGHPGQLVLAEWASGEIHRRPKIRGDCYPDESSSSVSGDMLTGYMLGMYETRDLDALKRLYEYGEKHAWVMGQPADSPRVKFSLTGQGRLARAIKKLGGPIEVKGLAPDPCLPVVDDYEYHLQTLGILLESEVSDGITDACLDALKRNAKEFPNDSLIQAAYGTFTGDMAPAITLLTGSSYICPTYVRPTSAYCTVHKLMAAKTVLKRFEK